jgi:hypothetical protein
MRHHLLAIVCALCCAGCFHDTTTTTTPDLTIDNFDLLAPPACPSGVDAIGKNRIPCGGSDTQCLYQESPQVTITCRCLPCSKVWECDAIAETCDAGTR